MGYAAFDVDNNDPAVDKLAISNSSVTGKVAGKMLTNNDIFGGSVGGLVGIAYTGVNVSNSHVEGAISGERQNVGGLIGATKTGVNISNSYMKGTVSDNREGGGYIGGLVGRIDEHGLPKKIRNSYADVTIDIEKHNNVGGLVGGGYANKTMGASVDIYESFATGNIKGNENVGGLVGELAPGKKIENSYAQVNITTDDYSFESYGVTVNMNAVSIGGLVGKLSENTTVTNSYAAGSITKSSNATYVGGLIGQAPVAAPGGESGGEGGEGAPTVIVPVITNSYWDTQTSGLTTSAGGVGKTTAEMKTLTTFNATTPAWDVVQDASLSNVYPKLRWATTGLAAGTSVWAIGSAPASGGESSGSSSGGGGTTVPSAITAYIRLLTGSSYYGETPILSYALYDAISGGNTIEPTVAGISGSVMWNNALTNTSNAGIYNVNYNGGLTLGNSAYTLASGEASIWTILPKPVTLNAAKIYDGSAAFDSGFMLSGMVNNDAVPTITGSAMVSSKNAGTYNAFDSSTLALSNPNYTLSNATISAVINAKPVNIENVTNATKTYDGTTNVAADLLKVTNLVTGDTINLTGNGSLKNKNAGSQNLDNVATGLRVDNANYTLAGGTVSGNVLVNPKTVSVTGSKAADKTYDATPVATITAGTLNGLVGSETLNLSATGIFDSPNAGNRIATATYTLADGTGLASNYHLTDEATTLNAVINPKTITVSGSKAEDKTYDATPVATITAGTLNGLVGSETLNLSATGIFDSPNAGNRIATATYTLADGTGLASNYHLTDEATTLNAVINPKTITVSGSKAADKTYDATPVATITAGTLNGLVGSETLNLSATGTFDSPNAGNRVATATYTLTDGTGLASNYRLSDEMPTLNALINSKTVSVSGSKAADKEYDATPVATITAGTLNGLVAGETLNLSATGIFDSPNAGNRVATATYTLADGTGLASNYHLTDEATTLNAVINPKTVSIANTQIEKRSYDGTVDVKVIAGNISGLLGDETVNLSVKGVLDNPNAGNRKAMVSYLLDNPNYSLPDTQHDVTIDQKLLGIVGTTVADKNHDGNNIAKVTAGELQGLINRETLNVAATGTFDNPDVGNDKLVTAKYTLLDGLNGGLANNYLLNDTTHKASILALAPVEPVTPPLVPIEPVIPVVPTPPVEPVEPVVPVVPTPPVVPVEPVIPVVPTPPVVPVEPVIPVVPTPPVVPVEPVIPVVPTPPVVPVEPVVPEIPTPPVEPVIPDVPTPPVVPVEPVIPEVPTEPTTPVVTTPNSLAEVLPPEEKQVVDSIISYVQSSIANINPSPSNVAASSVVAVTTKASSTGDVKTFSNVTSTPLLSATFGNGTPLALISAPDGDEPSQTVSLSEARQMMMGGNSDTKNSDERRGANGQAEASKEVRVPVSRNSLAEIVNGGVKLPGGVEQQLFVVKGN